MVNKAQFKDAAENAIKNIIRHGDTDIFPFPFEHYAFFDKQNEVVALIEAYNENFEDYLARFSPLHVSSLTPVTYAGFRWATQLAAIFHDSDRI